MLFSFRCHPTFSYSKQQYVLKPKGPNDKLHWTVQDWRQESAHKSHHRGPERIKNVDWAFCFLQLRTINALFIFFWKDINVFPNTACHQVGGQSMQRPRCEGSHMGHRADVESEGSYQSLYSQNRQQPKLPRGCPVVAGSMRAAEATERNKHTTSISPSPSLSVHSSSPSCSHTLCRSEAHCLSALSSVHLYNSAVQWPLTDPTWVTCLFTHREEGGGSSSLVLRSCLFVRPFRIVRRSERKSKESWL